VHPCLPLAQGGDREGAVECPGGIRRSCLIANSPQPEVTLVPEVTAASGAERPVAADG